MSRGRKPGPLAVAIAGLVVGAHVFIASKREKSIAYLTAYRKGRRVSILRTTKGTWRVERIL